MQCPYRRVLAATIVALMAMAAIVAPATSALHALDHTARDVSVEAKGDAPGGEADREARCELCEALANGRAALEPSAPALCLDLTLLERLVPIQPAGLEARTPADSESPRAPPLS